MSDFPKYAALVLLAAAGCAPPRTVVATPLPALNAPVHGITVEGFGEAKGQPNIARVNVGVEARAPSSDAAISEVNGRMAAVMAALKQLGIANTDLRTSSISLHFERHPEPPPRPVEEAPQPPKGRGPAPAPAPPPPPQPQGMFRASNMVEVTLRNLEQAGRVLTTATSAGANQLFGIQFEIENPDPLADEARKKAFEDAKKKATRLAQLAGVTLGPVVSVTEAGRGGPIAMPMAAMMQREAADVPIERGELKVATSVQVVFALGQ
jgi:uncharacterized protein YggE